jgi:hypothetical protein
MYTFLPVCLLLSLLEFGVYILFGSIWKHCSILGGASNYFLSMVHVHNILELPATF